MGCRELDIRDYFRFVEPGESVYARTRTFEKNRYKPVFHTVISNYRYYSPELGRWLSRDPIGEDGGYNLYSMVANDPLGRWDILGRWPNFISCFGISTDPDDYPDPRETCLDEGFYRHCVNTCLLSRCLSTVGLAGAILGPVVAEQAALEFGDDRGSDSTDVDANEYGMGNTYGFKTCKSMCLDDFNNFVAEKCCSSDETIDKSPDPPCCDDEE